MSEVRSTLDLVMERTRGMVQTPEERAETEREERRRRLRTMTQQLLERAAGVERLLEQIEQLERNDPPFPWRKELAQELAGRVSFGEGRDLLVDALIALHPEKAHDFSVAVAEALARDAELKASAEKRLLDVLAARGIRGTGVVANLQKDPGWLEEHKALEQALAERLASLAGR